MNRRRRSQAPRSNSPCSGISTKQSAMMAPVEAEAASSPPWVPFPDLVQASTEHQYILYPTDHGSATADFLRVLATKLCGTSQRAQLRERLDVLQERVATRMASGEAERLAGLLRLRRPITNRLEVGMTYIYFCLNEPSDRYPNRELLASLALWLLAESQHRMTLEPLEAITLQAQAGLCLAFALGEETGRLSAMRQMELSQEARKAQAIKAAVASHLRDNERKKSLLTEFSNGKWQSIPKAAMVLAPRHHFSLERVIRLLREAERSRDPSIPSPVHRRNSLP